MPYALLLGVLGALLNFIPYIGGLMAIALPMLMAFVTKDGYGYALARAGQPTWSFSSSTTTT